jgi:hypothetical protein
MGQFLRTWVAVNLAVAGLVAVAALWAAAEYPTSVASGVVLAATISWAVHRRHTPAPAAEEVANAGRAHVVRLLPDLEVTFRRADSGNPASWQYDRQLSASDPLFLYITMQTEHELTKWQLRTGQEPSFDDLVDDARADIQAAGPTTENPGRHFAGREAPPAVHLVEQGRGRESEHGGKAEDGDRHG